MGSCLFHVTDEFYLTGDFNLGSKFKTVMKIGLTCTAFQTSGSNSRIPALVGGIPTGVKLVALFAIVFDQSRKLFERHLYQVHRKLVSMI